MRIDQVVQNKLQFIVLSAIFCLGACNKLVQIGPPESTIITKQVFSDSADADAAVLGIYNSLAVTQSNILFGDGAITIFTGSSADELYPYYGVYSQSDQYAMYANTIVSSDMSTLSQVYWQKAYQIIYQANACITDVTASTDLTATQKSQLIGESEFLRAFSYFYLVNFFGDVPYITSINYNATATASRTSSSTIYQEIIADLKDAQNNLRADYSLSGGLRTRANQAAAAALLSRVYLYMGDWADAATEASLIIGNPTYQLASDPNSVFLITSPEAILQWQLNLKNFPFNATPEGFNLIPQDSTYNPYYCVDSQLLNAFEPGDLRKTDWIDSINYGGTEYYFPYKYKVGPGNYSPNGPLTEFYMVLRLSEMYLIRAEAEANGAGGGTTAAIQDLNKIRSRANLGPLSTTMDLSQTLAAISQERRIELFAEWGHRWLDLKRTGQIDSVMSIVTPQKSSGTATWHHYQALYPIPVTELTLDPNLTQNQGY